jgi:ABC-2 type transport system ATP-binding protein
MINVLNLSRSYGTFKAVDDVTFQVGKGQIVGLLGPNGAGKTTLMKMLTGYHFPASGSIQIGGFDLLEHTNEAQALIGYLPESSPVYPDLTVREYLEFMAGVRGIPQTDVPLAIERALDRTDASAFLNKVVTHLSKGQKQRVGLAQAILADPAILILDEPTSGLDPHQILEFRQLIQSIGKEKTVILSTHIMQEVEALCERVLIMNKGKIVAEGKAEDIAKSLQGENRYQFRVKGLAVADALATLARLPGLRGSPLVVEDGAEPLLTCAFPTDVSGGELLFDWAVAQKAKLVSLVPQTISLEDLFVQLTSGQPHAGSAKEIAR